MPKDREKKQYIENKQIGIKKYVLHVSNFESMYTTDMPTYISLVIQTERLSTRLGLYIEGEYIGTGGRFLPSL
jgi:hypothetical protein